MEFAVAVHSYLIVDVQPIRWRTLAGYLVLLIDRDNCNIRRESTFSPSHRCIVYSSCNVVM